MTAAAPPGERIIAWLREAPGPVSGEELARRLGCTRAAVWKQVAALRRQGWTISGRRSEGYRLTAVADRVDALALRPHLAGRWRRIEWRAEVDSTQAVARDLARAGAPEGTAVFAEAQTAGRGRLGRTWHSPPGRNLYCSIVLRPALPPAAVPQLALVAGLAAAVAIAETIGRRPALKWPNDVLLDDRKVVGVLTEMEAEVEQVRHVIAGIGINVNMAADDFPPELRQRATSLGLVVGRHVDRAVLAARLLAALEARYERYLARGFRALRDEWETYASLTGKEVRVAGPEGERVGRVLGLDDDGALRLAGADGAVQRVIAGEVTLRGDRDPRG